MTVSDINADMLGVGEQRARRRGLKGFIWKVENAEALSFADGSFDAYTIVFGIRNVTDIPAALREAHRVLKRGGRFYCMEFSSSDWPGFSNLYDAWASNVIPRIGKVVDEGRGELPLPRREYPPLPAPECVQGDGRRCRFRPGRGGADARRARHHSQRLEDLTTSVTHLWRLLKWGRTLARHGALRGIERDALTPAPVRRLVRIARLGARIPPTPQYADALVAIGPAAIKLGQALSTRPDLVGKEAAENLSQLQDDLPPAPFPLIRQAIERSFNAPLESLFSKFDEKPVGAASIAQVHRAITIEGRDVAVKVLRPGIEDEFAKAIETYEWAAAHVERYGGEVQRLRPRLVVAQFRQWTTRELDLQREAASASELRENMVAEPGYYVPEIDWRRTARRV